MAVPPGISERDFAAALQEFANAIGGDWVFESDEDLKLYRDAYSPFWGEPEERLASAAVAPANVEQVQAIVRIANKHKIPLWTICPPLMLATSSARAGAPDRPAISAATGSSAAATSCR
jgi:4-cresol dehydrogenase (hydroxylating)